MTAGTHSQGAFTQIIFSADGDTAPHSYAGADGAYLLEFLNESLQIGGRIVATDAGITGTRTHRSERARAGTPFRGGMIHMFVSPTDLVYLLPMLIGNNESPSGTFTVAADIPYFGILIDNDYSTFEFKDCKVNQWILRGRAPEHNEGGAPELMMLSMEIYASDHAAGTAWPGSPPSLDVTNPWVFTDAAITLEGSARSVEDFVIVCHNHLQVKYTNATTAHSICPRDRTIRGRFRVPWNATNADLYGTATSGAAASIVFTNGGLSTSLSFGRFQIPPERPMIPGKRDVPLILDGDFRGVSTTEDLVVVNDAVA